MALGKLTIEQAKANSADFMYIFADENKFLRFINQKYANVIRGKKANQTKLLMLSAKEYGKTYEDYTTAVREGFIETWGVTPAEALVTLAQGGSIAGKNWKEGVYGIGALTNTFEVEYEGNKVLVDAKTGHLFWNNQDITDTSKTVYKSIGGKSTPYQLFGSIKTLGTASPVFMSQYNKTMKKYYAQSFTDNGTMYSAKAKEITASDNADIWGAIALGFENFINWLVSLFTGTDLNKTSISAENTLPNQQADGFVYQSGMGEAGGILLLLAAGGALMAGGLGKKKKIKASNK